MRQARTLVIRVWCGQVPRFEPVRPEGDAWVLGRETIDGDSRMSRRHCEVKLVGGRWTFTDLGSANGSYVDARAVGGTLHCTSWRVLQVGRSLFMPLVVEAGARLRMRHTGDDIVGPGLHAAVAAARELAERGRVVVFTGESGCGFVQVARELHRVRGEHDEVGEFVAIEGGAAAELPARGTVLVYGLDSAAAYMAAPTVRAALAEPGLRLCLALEEPDAAVPDELRGRAGVVAVPGLERRAEEMVWWVRHAVRTLPAKLAAMDIDVTLPEACLLRPWAQGIADLVPEVQAAALQADKAGRTRVMGRDLSSRAGLPLDEVLTDEQKLAPRGKREPPGHLRDRNHVAAVLVTNDGDRAAAARTLGVTVEALEQWMRRHRLGEDPAHEIEVIEVEE